MKNNHPSGSEWAERILVAMLFILLGSFIMIVFSPWAKGPLLGKSVDYLAKIGVSLLLLAASLLARRSKLLEKYWQLIFGLFILSVTVSLELILGIYLGRYLGLRNTAPIDLALQKLNECLVVVCTVVTFTLVSGENLRSIYIQKGNLKLGLMVGSIAFLIFAFGSIPTAQLMFKANDLTMGRVLPWIPWALIFALANGALEELMFRGLFLRKLEPFFGKFTSNFLIALVFTVLHNGAFYTSDEYIFLAIVFPLALAWGYLTQKTDSLWGSILFHAGADIPVILGIFSNL